MIGLLKIEPKPNVPNFSLAVAAGVVRIEYDATARTGKLYLSDGGRACSQGATAFFDAIDRRVTRVEVISNMTHDVMTWDENKWNAVTRVRTT